MEFLLILARAIVADERANAPWAMRRAAYRTARLLDARGVPHSAGEAFDTEDDLLLLGPPGAGKSTLLAARASIQATRFIEGPEEDTARRVPLFATAIDIADSRRRGSASLIQSLAARCGATCGLAIDARQLHAAMEAGRIELLVDGLDEIGFQYNETVAALSDLFRTMPLLRAIVSTRPAALTVNFDRFATYTIPDLDRLQAQRILGQLGDGHEHGRLVERFTSDVLERPDLAGLVQAPLTLSLLFDTYAQVGRIPRNRSLLYATIIDIYFHRQLSRKVFDRTTKPRDWLTTVAAIATFMEQNGLYSLSRDQLTTFVERHVAEGRQAFDPNDDFPLDGLFFEHSDGNLSFIHRSLQEFFVAYYYRHRPEGLARFFSLEGGEAILEFASGLVDNVGPLVETAVSQGKLVLAAKLACAGRFENAALKAYVVQALRQALDPELVAMLAGAAATPQNRTRRPRRRRPPASAVPLGSRGDGEIPSFEGALDPPPGPRHDDCATLLGLLDNVRDRSHSNQHRGKLFEEFLCAFFGQIFIVVQQNRLTARGEIDIILEFGDKNAYWREFGNEALVECKNSAAKADVEQAQAFLSKVSQSRRRFGFFVPYAGLTQDAQRAFEANASDRNNPIVVPIAGDQIRQVLQRAGSIDEFLKAAYRDVTMPRRGRN